MARDRLLRKWEKEQKEFLAARGESPAEWRVKAIQRARKNLKVKKAEMPAAELREDTARANAWLGEQAFALVAVGGKLTLITKPRREVLFREKEE